MTIFTKILSESNDISNQILSFYDIDDQERMKMVSKNALKRVKHFQAVLLPQIIAKIIPNWPESVFSLKNAHIVNLRERQVSPLAGNPASFVIGFEQRGPGIFCPYIQERITTVKPPKCECLPSLTIGGDVVVTYPQNQQLRDIDPYTRADCCITRTSFRAHNGMIYFRPAISLLFEKLCLETFCYKNEEVSLRGREQL